MILTIDWAQFQTFYKRKETVYVKENEASWDFYTSDGMLIITSKVMKSPELERNIGFMDRYLKDVVRVLNVSDVLVVEEKEKEDEDFDDMFEDEDLDEEVEDDLGQ